ncbi:hypothetical protein Gotur_013257 [Gossypium turneri]
MLWSYDLLMARVSGSFVQSSNDGAMTSSLFVLRMVRGTSYQLTYSYRQDKFVIMLRAMGKPKVMVGGSDNSDFFNGIGIPQALRQAHFRGGEISCPNSWDMTFSLSEMIANLIYPSHTLLSGSDKLRLREVFTSAWDSGSLSGYIRTYVFVRFSSPHGLREIKLVMENEFLDKVEDNMVARIYPKKHSKRGVMKEYMTLLRGPKIQANYLRVADILTSLKKLMSITRIDMKDQMLEVQRNLMSQLTQLLDRGLEKGKNPVVHFGDDEDPAYFLGFTPTNIQTKPNTYPERVTVNVRPQYQTGTSTLVNFSTSSGSNLRSNLVKPVAFDDPKQARVEYPNTIKASKKKKDKGDNASKYNKGYSKPIIVDQSKTKTTSHQVPQKQESGTKQNIEKPQFALIPMSYQGLYQSLFDAHVVSPFYLKPL